LTLSLLADAVRRRNEIAAALRQLAKNGDVSRIYVKFPLKVDYNDLDTVLAENTDKPGTYYVAVRPDAPEIEANMNRASQQIVLENTGAIKFDKQPVATGRAQPISSHVRSDQPWGGQAGIGGCFFMLPHKRHHQLGAEPTSGPTDPRVFGRRQRLL